MEPAADPCARTKHLGPLAALFLLALALLFPAVFGGQTCFDIDFRYHQVPMRQFLLEEAQEGRPGLWWPAVRCGTPVHAVGEGGLLYPLNLPVWWARGVVQGSDLQALLHVFLCGVAAYALGLALGLRRAGALFAAMIVAAGGTSAGALGWPNALASTACGLGALALLARSIRRNDRALLCWAGVCWGLALLGGRPQRTIYLALLAPPLAATLGWERGGVRGALRGLVAAVACLVLGGLIGAAQALPTLELVAISERAAGTTELATSGASLGSLRTWLAWVGRDPAVRGEASELAHYLGAITWPLALAGAWAVFARTRGFARARWGLLLGMAAVGILLALGERTPLHGVFRATIPGFAGMRVPARALILATLGVAFLAGRALDRLSRAGAGGRVLAGLALVLLAVDLVPYARARQDLGPEDAFLHPPGFLQHLGANQPAGRVATLATRPLDPSAVPRDQLAAAAWVQRHEALDTNLGAVFGLHYSTGYGALLPRRYEALLRPSPPSLDALLDRLALAGTGLVLAPSALPSARLRPLPGFVGERPGDSAASVLPQVGLDPRPRLWLAETLRCVTSGDLEAARAALSPLAGAAVLELPEGLVPGPSGRGRIRPGDDRPGRIACDVEVPDGGWLVVQEACLPGWEARLDGRPVPLRHANILFGAVRVPPGSHRVELDYRPASWRWGLAGSALGLLLCLLGPWLPRKRP